MKGKLKNKENLRVAITGANGYVGSCIADYLYRHGCVVYEMGRTFKNISRKNYFIPYSLEKEISPNALKNINVLVHCAWDFKLTEWKDMYEVNVKGSLRLFQAAKKAGIKKIIFISTMSAFEGCKSMYGKAKLEIEKKGKKYGIISIRPGLVYNNQSRGMVGAIEKLVSALPIIPVVAGNQVLYLCHSDDLSRLILKLARESVHISKPITAASEKGLTFKQILRILVAYKGKKRLFMPVPSFFVLSGLKTVEKIGIKTRIKSDSLIGLLNADQNPDFSETRKIKAEFREFKYLH